MSELNELPTEVVRMNLKKQLKLYLAHRELSASDLARLSGVPKQSISGWLAGNNPRDVRQIKTVADVLETTIDNLIFGNGIKEETISHATDITTLIGDDWIGGMFEIKLRRVKR